MGPRFFLCKILSTGDVQRVPFEHQHYAEAGVPPAVMAGMPKLEAYQLVNKWNVNQNDQRFVYALE